jgi:thiosulfate reductase cytochrome b subunit
MANSHGTPLPGIAVPRHSLVARIAHWSWALALFVLVLSGLQIFNASPALDASDKSDASRRVLQIGAEQPAGAAAPIGVTRIFGHPFVTTGVLGYTDDGQGGKAPRAFPGWATLPAYQDLAGGRLWHFFFGWVLTLAIVAYVVGGIVRKDLRDLMPTAADFRNVLPMQLYYLRLRKTPPPHGKYNPLQKFTYLIVLFVFVPLVVLTGLALSPGVDAIAGPLTSLFGGRQFARLWHFVIMSLFVLYFITHMVLVFATGPWNNIRSMITGRYVLKSHDGVGR